MNIPIKTTIPALIALAAIVHTHAQDTATAAAEANFRSISAKAISPVTDRYISALDSLASKLDRAGKTTDAEAVTTELERIRNAIKAGNHPLDSLPGRAATHLADTNTSEYTAASAKDIFLAPDQATLTGAVKPHRLTRVLRGFFSEKDSATWTLEKFTPGTYDLILDYACPEKGEKNAGGGTITLTAGDAKTAVAINRQGTESDYRKKPLGSITLTASPLEISITTAKSETAAGVFRLRALILRPR